MPDDLVSQARQANAQIDGSEQIVLDDENASARERGSGAE